MLTFKCEWIFCNVFWLVLFAVIDRAEGIMKDLL